VFYQTDLVDQGGAGGMLMLQRFFDSSRVEAGTWSWLPYELVTGEDRVTLVDRESALQFEFRRGASGGWTLVRPRSDVGPILEAADAGGYRVRLANAFEVGFDASGKPLWTGRRSEAARRIRFHYAGGRLSRIEGNGSAIALEYDPQGRLVTGRSSDGNVVAYQWGAAGQLEGVTGPPGGPMRFGYDDRGRVIWVKGAADELAAFTNGYDSLGRLVEHQTVQGRWRFEYADLPDGLLRVRVRDQADETATAFYDRDRRLVAYGLAAATMTLLRQDEQGRLVQLARAILEENGGPEASPRFKVVEQLTPL
jgi:YD repeat-containing protein